MKQRLQLFLVTGLACALASFEARVARATTRTAPCALLTPTQISSVLGVTVGAPQSIGTTGCKWTTPDEPHPTESPVTATVVIWPSSAFEAMKAPLPRVSKTAASGVGDDAVYTTVGKFVTLSVKKGDVAFVIRLYGIHDADRQMTSEKALALDVLARL